MRSCLIIVLLLIMLIIFSCCKPRVIVEENIQYTRNIENDSTLTEQQKNDSLLKRHLTYNKVFFNKIYNNYEIPSRVDNFTKLDVIEMLYDSMSYLIVRNRNSDDVEVIINATKDKAIIKYYNSQKQINNKSNIEKEYDNSTIKPLYQENNTEDLFNF